MSWSLEKKFEPAGDAFEGIAKAITELSAYREHEGGRKALTAILMLAQAAARDHGDKQSLYVSTSGHVNQDGSGDYSVKIVIGGPVT